MQDPDEQARSMIRLVFEKFAEAAFGVCGIPLFHCEWAASWLPPTSAASGSATWNGARRLRQEFWRFSVIRSTPEPTRTACIVPGTKNPVTGDNEGGKWFLPPDEAPVLIHDRLGGLYHLGAVSGEPRAVAAEPCSEGFAWRAEAGRGAARRFDRLRQMRSSHEHAVSGRQEAVLSVQRVLQAKPWRTSQSLADVSQRRLSMNS